MAILVGSIVATVAALTTVAYRTVAGDLAHEARARVQIAARSRADAVSRIVSTQHARAERFLVSTSSVCGERRADKGTAWEEGCTRAALQEFRITEHAHGVVLFSDDRRVAGAGRTVHAVSPDPLALASLAVDDDGTEYYVIQVTSSNSRLVLEFPTSDLAPFFHAQVGLGEGEAFLRTASGLFLTPARYSNTKTPAGARVTEAVHPCSPPETEWQGLDYRGVDTFHGVQPVHVFAGGACVEAHLGVDGALQPATVLMDVLLIRGGLLAGLGVLVAVLASSWLALPVLRLAADAYALQDGDFDRPIRIGGPSEIAELGRSLGTMSRALADMISRERRARQEAEAANRAKDEFLAVLSHELRTPLTVTLGWARLLKMGHLDSQRGRGAIEAIERATITQTHLVNDLLDVSRIIAGRLQLERAPLLLSSPVLAAVDQIRGVAERKGVEMLVDVPDSVPVVGDAVRLQQVVSNLLTNAVKFTPNGGRIEIVVTRQDGHAEIVIRDTGEGIAPDVLPFIFDRFRQADGGPTRRYGGLGLGLAIVRHLVSLHGGSVQALSRGVGTGSVFIIQLPLATAPARELPPAAADSLAAPSRLTGVNLLLVEDDADTRQVVRAMLEDVGASVSTAASAAEARRLLAQTPPAVIVSDVAMPDEDGYALLRSIRERGVDVPAIALTAYARREDAASALAAGFQIHLPKPVDRAALIAAVGSLARAAAELDARTA